MSIWQNLRKAVRRDDVSSLHRRIWELEKQLSDPRYVLEKIFKRGIVFYDYDKIEDKAEKIRYYNSVKQILENDAFWNEYNHLVADMIQEVATSEEDRHRDKALRFSINGLEVFKERLESLTDPVDKEPTKDNLNDVI